MSDALDAARRKAETTYNAASDAFDAEPLAFWDRIGRRTIERLALRPGARVLDVCCGTGASALHAARAVGPGGRVLAVDLAENLLALGRAKAAAAGLDNIEFRRADMTALASPGGGAAQQSGRAPVRSGAAQQSGRAPTRSESARTERGRPAAAADPFETNFDAVVCVFGIFFVPDMEAQVAELWRLVRPGGQLAITTWGLDFIEPGYGAFRAAVRRVRPDLVAAFNPWDRITTPEAVRALFESAGIRGVDILAEDGWQPLRSPEDFWTIARGSGLRWTIDQMGEEEAADVKREVLEWLSANRVGRVATNAIYAVARRDPGA